MHFDCNTDSFFKMIEKSANVNVECARIILEKRKSLDEASSRIQNEIRNCFKRLEMTLKIRERQLLRQVDAIHRQQLSLAQSNLELVSSIPPLTLNLEKEQELGELILNFGLIQLFDNSIVNDSEPYKVVEYQEADKDHINSNKSLEFEETRFSKKHDISLKMPLKLDICTTMEKKSSIEETQVKKTEVRDTNVFIDEDKEKPQKEKENLLEENAKDFTSVDRNEHPVQIREWLQQILVETETEPVVHDIAHISGIVRSEIRPDLFLET